MKIPKPKSHSPKIHDNTEEDLILIPPSVLDNEMRDLEQYDKARGSVISDITLAVTLIVAVLTTTFRNLGFVSGATIQGAFIAGFIIMLVKISLSLYKIFWGDKKTRSKIIAGLLEDAHKQRGK